MIKKKELLIFLNKVEHKAVTSVQDRFNKTIEEEKAKLLEQKGFQARVETVQNKLNELFIENQSLMQEMEDDKSIDYQGMHHCYHSFNANISMFTGKEYTLSVIEKCVFDGGSIQKLRDKRDKEISEVKEQYTKVRTVCEDMTSSNKILEYLKALGFDLSTLEQAENNKLIPDIDKSKLFVCGENK